MKSFQQGAYWGGKRYLTLQQKKQEKRNKVGITCLLANWLIRPIYHSLGGTHNHPQIWHRKCSFFRQRAAAWEEMRAATLEAPTSGAAISVGTGRLNTAQLSARYSLDYSFITRPIPYLFFFFLSSSLSLSLWLHCFGKGRNRNTVTFGFCW